MTASFPWLTTYPTDIDWHAPLKITPLYDLLGHTREIYADRPAFDFMGAITRWDDIGNQVDHLAAGLQRAGFKKGDRIGIMLPNCPMFLVAYYAIARIGGIIVNFNPLYAERELEYQINDSSITLMITSNLHVLHDRLMTVLPGTSLKHILICPFAAMLPFPKNILFPLIRHKDIVKISKQSPHHLFLEDLMENDGHVIEVEINPMEDVALLQYTGGTTGSPKGAMLTHANIVTNTQQCGLWFVDCQDGAEKMLGVIPFFHVFAMTAVMNLSVLKGLQIIGLPRFELEETMKLIARKKPTLFPAVPAVFSAINHHPRLAQYDLRSLKHCVSGGAPLPVDVKRSFENNTGCVLVEGYGLTETSPVTHVNPLKGLNKPGSIGLPLPGTIVEIIDLHDRTSKVERGEKGEVCIIGPQVMKGYWNKPDETANVLRNGRLHTGDIGYLDEDGYTFIVDRLKDMIITNGYNVYPRIVEEAIYMHPDVMECVVAGLPDPDRGERVKAWIVMKQNREISAEKMKMFLRDKLSPMEMPRSFEFRTTPLPKTLIGKLSRKDLVAQDLATPKTTA